MKKMYFCKSGHNYEILALSTFFDKWSMFQIACMFACCCRNEEFYNDIATNVKIHTEEILNERNEILQRLEDIEGAKQQV